MAVRLDQFVDLTKDGLDLMQVYKIKEVGTAVSPAVMNPSNIASYTVAEACFCGVNEGMVSSVRPSLIQRQHVWLEKSLSFDVRLVRLWRQTLRY
mmetsp:Transcript_22055/g.52116  ORF Transcript_22055/g.52116 Transcript_22055/m.52116 type:complete len:95 (+) Transcript_22055:867-1151(+)